MKLSDFLSINPIVFLLAFPLLIYSYLMMDWTEDVRIFLGVAKITGFTPLPFPTNVDWAWEMKPLGNRLFFYVLNKMWESVSDPFLYQIYTKATMIVLITLVCYYFSYEVGKYLKKVTALQILLLSTVSFLSVGIYFVFQTESLVALLTLLCISLLLSDSKILNGLSGALMLVFFLLKGVTVLAIITVLVVCYLLDKKLPSKVLLVVYGLIASSVLFLISTFYLFPYVIGDALLSTGILQTFSVGIWTSLTHLIFKLKDSLWGIPMLIGFFFGYFLLIDSAKKKDMKRLAALLVLWLVPMLIIITQGKFFAYHYYVFLVPALVSILFVLEECRESRRATLFTATMVCILVLWMSANSIWSATYIPQQDYATNMQREADLINERYHLDKQPSLLFFDSGSGPWYFSSPTACRYISPYPVQREIHPAYDELVSCVESYRGEYILTNDAWFGNKPPLPGLTPNTANYWLVYKGLWEVYQRESV